jgi:hypothetical protein
VDVVDHNDQQKLYSILVSHIYFHYLFGLFNFQLGMNEPIQEVLMVSQLTGGDESEERGGSLYDELEYFNDEFKFYDVTHVCTQIGIN